MSEVGAGRCSQNIGVPLQVPGGGRDGSLTVREYRSSRSGAAGSTSRDMENMATDCMRLIENARSLTFFKAM